MLLARSKVKVKVKRSSRFTAKILNKLTKEFLWPKTTKHRNHRTLEVSVWVLQLILAMMSLRE
jgi:hypothetical protein